jgi:hypothetical protein
MGGGISRVFLRFNHLPLASLLWDAHLSTLMQDVTMTPHSCCHCLHSLVSMLPFAVVYNFECCLFLGIAVRSDVSHKNIRLLI